MTQEEFLQELAAQISQHGIDRVTFFMGEGSDEEVDSDVPLHVTDVRFVSGNIEVTLEP